VFFRYRIYVKLADVIGFCDDAFEVKSLLVDKQYRIFSDRYDFSFFLSSFTFQAINAR
jgi:hypothetical protein